MRYEALCKKIIELVGGKDNVDIVVHCATRLRFTLKDRSLADIEAIKDMPEVIDVVSNKVSFQIIIGTEVSQIHPELQTLLGNSDELSGEVSEKKNVFKSILDVVSESMTPLMPAMMAIGLLAGILSILTVVGILTETSSTYIIFNSIKEALFYFLPVFMAMSASKRLGASQYLGVLLAATLLTSTINGVEGLSLFGISLPTITYSSTFFPILLGLWFMGKVTPVVQRVLPKTIEYFVSPVIIMLLTLPVTLFLFGPIGTWISDGMSFVVTFLSSTFGAWIVVVLYAAINPFLITMGAGNFVIPLIINAFATQGFENMFIPAYLISDLAVSGVMLGYFLRAKEQKQKQFFGTVAFSAFMGITEPAVFGAFVKYRRPYVAVIIAGGIGGLVAGLMNVKAYSLTTLFGIVSFIGDNDYTNFYAMVASLVIGFIIAIVAGFLLWLPKDKREEQIVEEKKVKQGSALTKVLLSSPVAGKRVQLSKVKDDAFSTGALGEGIGIIPEDDLITSPIAGEIVSLFPTNHAVGIKSEDGIEVLLHIGVDTVELEGKYFESLIKQGDVVKAGDPLINVDIEKIKAAGYDPTVIMVITNTQDYLEVLPSTSEEATPKNDLITVIL